jgi:hypothetical protein
MRIPLNPRCHFHLVVLDGLFTEQSDGAVRFDEATHLRADDAHALQRTVQRRVLGLFERVRQWAGYGSPR